MDIKKGTKLKLKWQFLNEGEPVSFSDYSKFRLDVLDVKKVPQRTSVTLAENEVVFSIDTEKYENGRFSVRVDADGPDGVLHICHCNAFRIVPANAKSSLAKGAPGENYELTIKDDLSGQTQSVIEEQDPTVPDHVKAITQHNITDWCNKQDLLVSGTNIKTILGKSLLGSGDINVNEYKIIAKNETVTMVDQEDGLYFLAGSNSIILLDGISPFLVDAPALMFVGSYRYGAFTYKLFFVFGGGFSSLDPSPGVIHFGYTGTAGTVCKKVELQNIQLSTGNFAYGLSDYGYQSYDINQDLNRVGMNLYIITSTTGNLPVNLYGDLQESKLCISVTYCGKTDTSNEFIRQELFIPELNKHYYRYVKSIRTWMTEYTPIQTPNSDNLGWVEAIETYPSLAGNAGKVLRVKADETGVEWVSID